MGRSQADCFWADDYFNAGYGRIIMVPRVKLAYDKVRPASFLRVVLISNYLAASIRRHPP